MEFRIENASGGGGMKGENGDSILGCKWPETKRGPKLRQNGPAGLFVNTL
jgi:hypothetical protein